MGLFENNDNSNSTTKHHTDKSQFVAQIPVIGSFSFHDVCVIISGASMAIVCLVTFYLIMRHATHYSLPKEQKQVIRIVFMVPVFSLVTFLSIAFNGSAIYIKSIEAVYEGIAFSSFFLLLCEFVRENEEDRLAFLATSGATKQHKFACIGVFQLPIAMLLQLIVTDITQAVGVYCEESNKLYFAKIWVCDHSQCTSLAILSVLKFYKVTKDVTKPRKPLSKLLAFKAIIGLSFLQNLVFSFLQSSMKPTDHYTYNDLTIGLPNLLLSVEMIVFALAFLYVFRAHEYYSNKVSSVVPLGHGGYQGGFLGIKAIIQAFSLIDIIKGIASIPKSTKPKPSTRPIKAWDTGSSTEYVSLDMQQNYGQAPEYPHDAAHPQGMPYQQGALYQQDNVQLPDAYHAGTPLIQDTGYHH
ncbi:Transmembrane protein [Lachnellula occidentalis]|uniref:Transmembrane protein n=1 Tax=Lachnellula occidentalis TaxID=215460 RepID=A0A8H8RSH7_9HELO|nr:Transmembrane protein [Lachnellula occidentalis]